MKSSRESGYDVMEKQTFGTMIASLRKEAGMTQLELAEKMGLTVEIQSRAKHFYSIYIKYASIYMVFDKLII